MSTITNRKCRQKAATIILKICKFSSDIAIYIHINYIERQKLVLFIVTRMFFNQTQYWKSRPWEKNTFREYGISVRVRIQPRLILRRCAKPVLVKAKLSRCMRRDIHRIPIHWFDENYLSPALRVGEDGTKGDRKTHTSPAQREWMHSEIK